MKRLSPVTTHLSPLKSPPFTLVVIFMLPLMLTMAPASADALAGGEADGHHLEVVSRDIVVHADEY